MLILYEFQYLFLKIKMDLDQNSYTTINEAYKIWKKHSPFLYNILQVFQLQTCSQTVEYFADFYIQNDWKMAKMLIGTNSLTQNALLILGIGIPTQDSAVDYSYYRQQKSEYNIGANGYIGTLGIQQVNVKLSIPQSSEIMKARINKFNEEIIALKTGGADPEYIIYDTRNKEADLEKKAIKLIGHSQQGFGLAWSPHENSKILSGSYDKKILIHDIAHSENPQVSYDYGSEVQDVKWANMHEKIIASAHQDSNINIWDIRQRDNKPQITRKAHNGEVYSVDFNKSSEYLLLSGGQDGDVCLWDIRNMKKKLHVFIGHNDSVNTVVWSPLIPVQFASGSSDRRIVLWDIQKLNENTAQKSGNQIIYIHGGHRSKITDLSWSKQHKVLGSCQQNNILHVWKANEHSQRVSQMRGEQES